MKYPDHLLKLIHVLRKLPGVGEKSAERFAFQMLGWKREHLHEMGTIVQTLQESLTHCPVCGCLSDLDGCEICPDERRNRSLICVVATTRDVFAIEQTHEYQGHYHVLGGLLSPMEGIGPDSLQFETLHERISEGQIKEVVIAIDSTLEGDATALFLRQQIEKLSVTISRLAFGLPMGSSLDYVDGGTLARAFSGRAKF